MELREYVNYPEDSDNTDISHHEPNQGCSALVSETVGVQGTVTITPILTNGSSRAVCVGRPEIVNCPDELPDSCSFVVRQNVRVEIPLTFSAEATVDSDGVVCGVPEVRPRSR